MESVSSYSSATNGMIIGSLGFSGSKPVSRIKSVFFFKENVKASSVFRCGNGELMQFTFDG